MDLRSQVCATNSSPSRGPHLLAGRALWLPARHSFRATCRWRASKTGEIRNTTEGIMDRERYYGLSKRSQNRKMKEVPRTTAQSHPDFAVELQKHRPSQFGSPKHDQRPLHDPACAYRPRELGTNAVSVSLFLTCESPDRQRRDCCS